ncbi:potassium channel subfamily K member 17 isoform X4 [Castor canadensis]|uniref:Potassium channel subfamily K member 17 isoform X4 n=5 Tax=Castor canadensis TaxID=51338 RepID=A0AC58N9U6_CASCN
MCPLRAGAAPECRARGCWAPGTGLLLLAYLAYLVLGAGVFQALEGRAAQDFGRSFQRDKWELLENFTCLDRPALDLLIRDIIQAYKDGAHLLDNTTSMGRWEFMGSFFFSVSTITTIGYGNLSPQTVAARLFCIFFALVGIPLNLVVLNRLGDFMLQGVHRCAHRLGGGRQGALQAEATGQTLCAPRTQPRPGGWRALARSSRASCSSCCCPRCSSPTWKAGATWRASTLPSSPSAPWASVTS